jgi:hypothetical protein
MRRRAQILIGLGIILLALIGAVIFSRSNEPMYEGRTLSEWMGDYHMPWGDGLGPWDEQMRRHENASNAIVRIGPKAIPYLLKWLDYEQPSWSVKFCDFLRNHCIKMKFGRTLLYSLESPQTISIHSPYTFRVLGPCAEEAIPKLAILLNNPKREVAQRAGAALSTLGSKGLSPLMTALVDTSRTNRADIALCIGSMCESGRPAIPLLIRCIKEQNNKELCACACAALSQIQPDPDLVLPDLIDSIADTKRRNIPAIRYLEKIGPVASNAVPVLLIALRDPDPGIREYVTNALKSIDTTALEKASRYVESESIRDK